MTVERPRIALVVTVPGAVRSFLRPHIEAMAASADVTLFCNLGGRPLEDDLADLPVRWVEIDIRRQIAPFADVKALCQLWWAFRYLRPNLVHSLLPKSGLFGMMAAWSTRVPHRLHTFTGQVWATRSGLSRLVLKNIDRLIASFTTQVITDSPSQRSFLFAQGIVREAKVFGEGSICGVDSDRFRPCAKRRLATRENLGLDREAFVLGFVGRLNRDKGVLDLVQAFDKARLPASSRLIFVGPDEEDMAAEIACRWRHLANRIIITGALPDVECILPAFDLFCLPSYREGFGSSAIEASACGVPVLASRIYGLVDAVDEGKTGWMHPAGDIEGIRLCMEEAYRNPDDRHAFGKKGREKAVGSFSTSRVVSERQALYDHLLGENS